MLILTRRVGEHIRILNIPMQVKVLNVHNRCVRLGFEAPREIVILREEVYQHHKIAQQFYALNRGE